MKVYVITSILVLFCFPVFAEIRTVEVLAKDGKFSPTEIEMTTQERIILVINNQGSDAEEFESIPLHKEKIVLPGRSISLKIGPLPKGVYHFFGDFHPETAQGNITVK